MFGMAARGPRARKGRPQAPLAERPLASGAVGPQGLSIKTHHYDFYKGRKERAMEIEKQLNIVRLFGLTDEKVYARLGELAGEELEKKKNEIGKSFIAKLPFGMSYEMGRAFKSYRQTIDKIETLKGQSSKPEFQAINGHYAVKERFNHMAG